MADGRKVTHSSSWSLGMEISHLLREKGSMIEVRYERAEKSLTYFWGEGELTNWNLLECVWSLNLLEVGNPELRME